MEMRRQYYVLTLILLIVSVTFVNDAFGHGTVDQQYAPAFAGAGWNWVGLHNPIGQSFTPTLPTLVAVDVGIENTAGVARTLIVSIRSGSLTGAILGTETVSVSPGGPSWVHIDFSPVVSLVPATLYYLRLVDPLASAGIRWYITIPGGTYPGGNSITSGTNQPGGDYFFRTYGQAATLTTDWAVTSVWTVPTSPAAGDAVTFHALVNIVSTTGSYPQSVAVSCSIDGFPCGTGTFTFTSTIPISVSTATPWIATAGTHLVTWTVDPGLVYNDPNRANNVAAYPFIVTPGPPGPPPGPTPSEFDFTITASPTSATVNAGEQTIYTANLGLASGTTKLVSLAVSGLPAGAMFQLNPPSGEPAFTTTLVISAQPTAAAGTYQVTLTGSGGGKTHSVTLTLIIAAAGDFSLTTATPSQTVAQGQSSAYIINLAPVGTFSTPVSMTVAGLPTGSTGTFEPSSAVPPTTATLRVNVGPTTPPGTYTLTVTGSAAGRTKTTTLVLNVSARSVGAMEQLQDYWPIILALIILLIAVLIFLRSRQKPRKRKG